LHGPFGEDGTLQGLLEIAGLPYVGSGVLGSAVGMDKDVAKRLLRDAGVPVAAWIALSRRETRPSFSETSAKLGLPLFVKPSNMGSSVGVHKVHDEAEWNSALDDAFLYDECVLIEEFIAGHEIECAVLEDGDEIRASVTGEIIPAHEFYSYDAKYLDENGARFEIPTRLPPKVSEKVRELAVQSFKLLRARGLARVDFFVTADGAICVNEINTMPGFTNISMFPTLWGHSGIAYTELITKLISQSLKK
jgi:D-alanine-D-alanine ligase